MDGNGDGVTTAELIGSEKQSSYHLLKIRTVLRTGNLFEYDMICPTLILRSSRLAVAVIHVHSRWLPPSILRHRPRLAIYR